MWPWGLTGRIPTFQESRLLGMADIGKNTNLVGDVLGPALTRFVAKRLNLSQAPGAIADARR
jgi:hypothetical protein